MLCPKCSNNQLFIDRLDHDLTCPSCGYIHTESVDIKASFNSKTTRGQVYLPKYNPIKLVTQIRVG